MDTILNYKEDTLELEEGIHDPAIFKGIVLAGGPGSGKSYVAKKLGLDALGMRVINSDHFFECFDGINGWAGWFGRQKTPLFKSNSFRAFFGRRNAYSLFFRRTHHSPLYYDNNRRLLNFTNRSDEMA